MSNHHHASPPPPYNIDQIGCGILSTRLSEVSRVLFKLSIRSFYAVYPASAHKPKELIVKLHPYDLSRYATDYGIISLPKLLKNDGSFSYPYPGTQRVTFLSEIPGIYFAADLPSLRNHAGQEVPWWIGDFVTVKEPGRDPFKGTINAILQGRYYEAPFLAISHAMDVYDTLKDCESVCFAHCHLINR